MGTPNDQSSNEAVVPDNDAVREAEAKRLITSQAKRAIDLRSKDREFHGLEREFLYHQAEMLADYNKSKDVKHPRDVGTVREVILRKFLSEGGYLPKRYSVSQSSARVASTTGHISNEIDILLYDPLDSLRLMNREDVYEVMPVESVYGVIQVKSRLNKKEIKDGLENLASFKRLNRMQEGEGFRVLEGREERGFGVLFAYDSDLEWRDILREIETFAKNNPSRVWCNGIFILSKGVMFHGEDGRNTFKNSDLEKIQKLQMHGFPNRHDQCLYQFQHTLLSLLRDTKIQPAGYDGYFRLPLIAGEYSYEFSFGNFVELAACEEHGDFQRKIDADQLAKLIDWCKQAEPINWIRATDIAYGKPGNNEEAYVRQPGDVRIYNPEKLPLSEILVNKTTKALAFDSIVSAGMTIFIPFYYSEKEGIIGGCPKCKV